MKTITVSPEALKTALTGICRALLNDHSVFRDKFDHDAPRPYAEATAEKFEHALASVDGMLARVEHYREIVSAAGDIDIPDTQLRLMNSLWRLLNQCRAVCLIEQSHRATAAAHAT